MSRDDEKSILALMVGIGRARARGETVTMVLPTADGERRDEIVPMDVLSAFAEVLSVIDTGATPIVVNGRRDLTTTQAAGILSISRTALMKLIDAGELTGHRVGTHTRLRLAEVMAYRRRLDTQARSDAAVAMLERADEATAAAGY